VSCCGCFKRRSNHATKHPIDVKCSKSNQFGHEFIICKRKIQKQEADVQVVDQDKED
jgi:hypothetical protein